METQYKVINGTSYHSETNDYVVKVLEDSRINHIRLRVHFGDVLTGCDYMDTYDVTGYIGRSTGSIKIPLLVYNARSMGGGGLLDNCLVKITESKGKRVLYQHPNYHTV